MAQIGLGPTFSYSSFPELMGKWYENGSVLISAVFWTR